MTKYSAYCTKVFQCGNIDQLERVVSTLLKTAIQIYYFFMKYFNKIFLILVLTLSFISLSAHDLKGAVASDDRTPKNMLRDKFRNPVETLSFFGIESDMTVVELSPGGGWYTCLLYTSPSPRD